MDAAEQSNESAESTQKNLESGELLRDFLPMKKKKPLQKMRNLERLISTTPRNTSQKEMAMRFRQVLEKAKEFEANLDPKFPSFIKLMLCSHVRRTFWLKLPSSFCKMHLPEHDETIILEGETREEYKAKYIAHGQGLSGGWRRFALAQKMCEGDVVVIQLVGQTPPKFKVHIIRANGLSDQTNESNFKKRKVTDENDITMCKNKMDNRVTFAQNLQERGLLKPNLREEVPDNVENFSSRSFVDFQNFSIVVNSLNLDSKFSQHLRTKYYELCCAQGSYLHDKILKSIGTTLAAGIIIDTVKIAHSIRASTLSTPSDDYAIWDKQLESFELLGMNVGFLRGRLDRLISLVTQLRDAASKRLSEIYHERDKKESDIEAIQIKLGELVKERRRIDSEIETLKAHIKRDEVKFKEVANAPW